MDYTCCQQPTPTVNTHQPLDDCRKKKPFIFKTNRLFFVRSLPQLLSCISVLFNFVVQSRLSRNFHYDAMQQYQKTNFSDVFCLNCIFVIDATMKHLISRSFLKCGVSAVTMAAHKHFFNKIESNLHYTRFIDLAVVPKRGNEWRGPTHFYKHFLL